MEHAARRVLVFLTIPDAADNHAARVNPHAYVEADLLAALESCGRVEDTQPGSNRAIGIVFVGDRPSEVGNQPVAQLFGHVPVEPAHDVHAALLELRYDVDPVFRVELLREPRRIDDVAEQYREVTTFTGAEPRAWSYSAHDDAS